MSIRDVIWNGVAFDTIDADTIDSKDSSSFSLNGHVHDYLGPAGNWNTNGAQDLLCHNKRALVGMTNGQLHLGYDGDFTDIRCGNNFRIYHEGNKPTATDVGALALTGGTLTGTLTTREVVVQNGYALKHGANTIIGTDGKVYRAVWNDYAELFEKEDNTIEAGDILAWGKNGVLKASNITSKAVVGIYSDTYGTLLGGEDGLSAEENLASNKYAPVGLSGRVYVKVIGDINIGDLITISDVPGVGCKAETYIPGTIVGKAIGTHTGNSIKRIQMLIMNI